MSSYFIDHIINFAPINQNITTSGQPDRNVFPIIKSAGYEMVIYLATPASSNHIPEEEQIVRELGMEYIHIPVIWESPQPAQFDEFVSILARNGGKKIFIHCALNYRVSAFMFLYQVFMLNSDPESAWWTMLEIWEPNPTWRAFIRTVMEQHHAQPFSRLDYPDA